MSWRGWWVSLSLWVVFAASAMASDVVLRGDEAKVSLASALEIHEDKGAAMDVAAVVGEPFVPASPALLHPGYSASAIWLRFSLSSASAVSLVRWLAVETPRLQDVSLFVMEQGAWRRVDAGTHVPFGRHPLRAIGAVFPLTIPPGQTVVAYLRVASATSISIMPTLWEPVAFREAESDARMGAGLVYGSLVLTALFGVLMFAALKDRAFLLHAMATLCYVLGDASINGYGFAYVWPDATDWATRSIAFGGTCATTFLLLFVRSLIRTAVFFPRWDFFLRLALLVQPIIMVGLLAGDYRYWASVSTLASILIEVLVVVSGGLGIWYRLPASRFYAAAFLVVLLGNVTRFADTFGILLPPHSAYLNPMAIVLANILMLSAVVDRIMLARAEKEAAQKALYEALEAHDAQLERAVMERTAELGTALNQVRGAHQMQSQLLGYISHDLRTPLATIINYVRLLSREEDDARRYHETIERSASYQLALIDELLEYSRGELNRLELNPVPTYLWAWLRDSVGQAELLAMRYGNRFTLKADDDLPAVVVFDPKRLRQVLLNLLSNAAKFTSNGEIRLYVGAMPASAGNVTLSLAVEDTGPGIPAHDRERIFLPFERRQSDREGTGLGLSIARQVVEAMGGELRLESDPGLGSRFSFALLLPLADEAEVLQPAPAIRLPEPFGKGKRVLVADDHAASRDYLRELLSMADFDVVEVVDGAQALQAAMQQSFDMLVVDQWMPEMDAWALLGALRDRLSALPPVVLCSAMAPQRPDGFPSDLDFSAVLLKPVGAETLLRTMRVLVGAVASEEGAPERDVARSASISDTSLAALQGLVALGNVTEIEEWANALEDGDPGQGSFARQVAAAARNLDVEALQRLSGMA